MHLWDFKTTYVKSLSDSMLNTLVRFTITASLDVGCSTFICSSVNSISARAVFLWPSAPCGYLKANTQYDSRECFMQKWMGVKRHFRCAVCDIRIYMVPVSFGMNKPRLGWTSLFSASSALTKLMSFESPLNFIGLKEHSWQMHHPELQKPTFQWSIIGIKLDAGLVFLCPVHFSLRWC